MANINSAAMNGSPIGMPKFGRLGLKSQTPNSGLKMRTEGVSRTNLSRSLRPRRAAVRKGF